MDVGTTDRVFGDISNPDVVIGGTVSIESSVKYSYARWVLNARYDSTALNTVIQLGGLGHASSGSLQNGEVRMEKAASGTNTVALVFANAADTITPIQVC